MYAPGFGMAKFFWNRSKMVTRAQFPSVNTPSPPGISIAAMRWGRTFRLNSRAPPESTEIAWRNEFRKRRNAELFLLIPEGRGSLGGKCAPSALLRSIYQAD